MSFILLRLLALIGKARYALGSTNRVPLWRALVVANLVTGEKIPLTETHGQNLSQICINDVGDKIIAQDPTNIYIFCINNTTNNTQMIGRHTLQHQFCQKPRLLDISSNGTWVVSAAADDSVLLWEFQPTGYCKKKISVQEEKIIGSSFTKGDNLVLSTHSKILLFDLTKNQNAAHIFLTNRPLTDLSCTADKNNSLILTFQKDGKNQSVGATLIEMSLQIQKKGLAKNKSCYDNCVPLGTEFSGAIKTNCSCLSFAKSIMPWDSSPIILRGAKLKTKTPCLLRICSGVKCFTDARQYLTNTMVTKIYFEYIELVRFF